MKTIPINWKIALICISIISLGGIIWSLNLYDETVSNWLLITSSILFFVCGDLVLVHSKVSIKVKILIPLIVYSLIIVTALWGYFLPNSGIVGLWILAIIELPVIFLHPIILVLYAHKTDNLKNMAVQISFWYAVFIGSLFLYGFYVFPKPYFL